MAQGPSGSSTRPSNSNPRALSCASVVEVGDPVQEDRRVAGEVLGEEQSRDRGTDLDLGYASAHRLDSEGHAGPEHVPVELEVGLDIATWEICA